jgi:hypothetical protein
MMNVVSACANVLHHLKHQMENRDGNDTDDDQKNILPKNKSFKKPKTSEGQAQQRALEPEPERLIPPPNGRAQDDIDKLV